MTVAIADAHSGSIPYTLLHSTPSLVSLARLVALFWRPEGTATIFPSSTAREPRAETRIHTTDGD
jgi:hypothetical protein